MPKKPITLIGAVVILGAGIYCFSGLFQYRSKLPSSSTQLPFVTGAAFLALVLAIGAVFFWYYLNEKQGGGGKGTEAKNQKPDTEGKGSETGDQKPGTGTKPQP